MPDRVDDLPVLLIPRGRGPVERGDGGRLGPAQLQAQEVGEEVVVAEPRPLGVERDDERVRLLEREQDPLGAGAPEQGVGQRTVDPLEDRRAQQQPPHLFGLALEHLGQQVVGDGSLAAGELGDEPLGVGMAGERQRGQPQPRRPALGAGVQLGQPSSDSATPETESSSRSPQREAQVGARSSVNWPARRSRCSPSCGSWRVAR